MKLINHAEVQTMTGLSRFTLLRLEKKGKFPGRKMLGERRVMWDRSEVEKWLKTLKGPCRE